MSTFQISFFELAFLAEACLPPMPIARTVFWQNLTKVYWSQMTENERERMFSWVQKSSWYNESLEKEEETQIFHARFNPDNQYMVKVNYEGKEEEHRAFMKGDRYWTNHSTFIAPEYIISVEKFTPKIDD